MEDDYHDALEFLQQSEQEEEKVPQYGWSRQQVEINIGSESSGNYLTDDQLEEVQCLKCGDSYIKRFEGDHKCVVPKIPVQCPLCGREQPDEVALSDHVQAHELQEEDENIQNPNNSFQVISREDFQQQIQEQESSEEEDGEV